MIETHPPLKSIVVVGCQRSGTTLLGQILGAHKDCFLVDEFEGLYPWYKSWVARKPEALKLLGELVAKSARKYQDRRREFVAPRDLLASTVVAKAPNLTFEFEQLSKHQPRPKIVFMVRDARAVVSSMLQLSHIDILGNQIKLIMAVPGAADALKTELRILLDCRQPHYLRLAAIWVIKTGLYRSFQLVGLDPFLLRYEDLVNNTQYNISQIARHCGLAKYDEFPDYTAAMQGWGPGNTSREKPVHSDSLRKWRSYMSEHQASAIVEMCGNLMTELEYEEIS